MTSNTTVVNPDGTDIGEKRVVNAAPQAYVTNLVVSPAPATLFGFSGYNSKGSAQFIQWHNAAFLPADASIPRGVMTVGAGSNFSVDFGPKGRHFSKGITITNSSTGPTLTIGSADIWIDAQYRSDS